MLSFSDLGEHSLKAITEGCLFSDLGSLLIKKPQNTEHQYQEKETEESVSTHQILGGSENCVLFQEIKRSYPYGGKRQWCLNKECQEIWSHL